MNYDRQHRITVRVEEGEAQVPTEINYQAPNTQLKPQDNPATKPSGFGGISMRNIITGAFVGSAVKRTALGTIGRIGEYTGNTYLQSQINGTMSLAGYIGGIAIGGAAGVAYALVDIGTKEVDFQVQRYKATVRTQFYAEQIGIATYNGSRNRGKKI
jgi:hypothetical protein